MTQFSSIADLEEHVRSHTQSAALTAGLLILFGFFALGVQDGDDLFSQAGNWFVYALRIGGIAMVIVAVWCSIGHGFALLADAVVSCSVGAILVVTGILMLIDGGGVVQNVINCICGAVLTSFGIRSGHTFREAARLCRREEPLQPCEGLDGVFVREDGADTSPPPSDQAGGPPAVPSAFIELREETPQPTVTERGGRFAVDDEPISLAELGASDRPGDPTVEGTTGNQRLAESPRGSDGGIGPLTGGSLADFADDDARKTP